MLADISAIETTEFFAVWKAYCIAYMSAYLYPYTSALEAAVGFSY
jgi:hypothetical protein